ncbi:hypothetical protein SOM61_04010 [Massilia sp. CFBP9012]|nr:hypothetical protein [Massilia sp. CFBP9012]
MATIMAKAGAQVKISLREGKPLSWSYLLLALPVALYGPYPWQGTFLLITLGVSLYIFITRTGHIWQNGLHEKRRVALVMLVYIAINICVTSLDGGYSESKPYNDVEFWFANRFVHLFGIAFFMTPLVTPLLEKSKKHSTLESLLIGIGCLLAYFGFVIFCLSRQGPSSESWYSPAMLMDDVFMSVGIGLLLSLFTTHAGDSSTAD